MLQRTENSIETLVSLEFNLDLGGQALENETNDGDGQLPAVGPDHHST